MCLYKGIQMMMLARIWRKTHSPNTLKCSSHCLPRPTIRRHL